MDKFTCSICNRKFASAKNIVRHRRTHIDLARRKTLACPQCDKVYMTTYAVNQHVKRAHAGDETQMPFGCTYCGKRFWVSADRDKHITTHTGERPFPCPECRLKFGNKTNRDRHVRGMHRTTEAGHVCPKPGCGKRFNYPHKLKRHLGTHDKARPKYSCLTCGQIYKHRHHLARHVEFGHNGRGKEYACTYCDKLYARKDHLKDHLRRHTGERPYACSICQAKFTSSSDLNSHRKVVHISERLNCTLKGCGQTCKGSRSLAVHLMTHSDQRPMFACSTCRKEFVTKTVLKRHIQVQHETRDKQHSCLYCDKKFAESAHLLAHVRSHTGETPYSCSMCPRRFTTRGGARNHESGFHRDEQKYNCQHCGRQFKQLGNWKSHMETHKNVEERRMFECPFPLCGKKFVSKAGLKSHALGHGNRGDYEKDCPICKKTFARPSGLSRHVKIHTGEK